MSILIPGSAQPDQYQLQLERKTSQLQLMLSRFDSPEITVHSSPKENYRFRAEFAVWHHDDNNGGPCLDYVMRNSSGEKVFIDVYSIGSDLIQALMPALKQLAVKDKIIKEKLFQCEFLTSRKGEALITLIYHKPLSAEWVERARIIRDELAKNVDSINVVGRSRKQKIIIDQDFIYEEFNVGEDTYRYQQIENSFTQPNAYVNEKMLNWAFINTRNIGGDLLELYCGNGNFTLPLSKSFNKVLATEVSKSSIKSLGENLSLNGIGNVAYARLNSTEAAQAIEGIRPFRRLAHVGLDAYQFTTVFVDPPRAGLDADSLNLVKQFDHICYVSCNPDTLIENLSELDVTHKITSTALFDQFPYTDHVECGVILQSRSSN